MLPLLLACGPGADPPATKPPPEPAPAPEPTVPEPPRESRNVLLVILDDVGVDVLAAYGVGETVARTPNIDILAEQGVTFLHAYANPTCSPTRAMLMTGRHAWRTGIGHALAITSHPLLESELTVAELLELGAPGVWDRSYVGKWHLGTDEENYAENPNRQGFDWYSGTLTGIDAPALDGLPQDYYSWEEVTNGVAARNSTYVSIDNVDDAIARIEAMTEPWFMVLAPFAAHAPRAPPPPQLWDESQPIGTTRSELEYFATIEAMDHELGRLMVTMRQETLGTDVLLVSDNGTPTEFTGGVGKGDLYEGGVRIPLIVAGPSVEAPGTTCGAVVSAVDVFATVGELAGLDLAGLSLPEHDSLSFASLLQDPTAPAPRTYAYSERFRPSGPGPYWYWDTAVRDARWRLVRSYGVDELYDLGEGHVEGEDLLADGALTREQQAAYDALVVQIPEFAVATGTPPY